MTKKMDDHVEGTPKKGLKTRAELLRGATGSVVIKFLSLSLGLVTTVILGRYLGAEQFGLYTLAFTVANFVGIPLLMGGPPLVTREVAKLHQKNDWPELKGFLIRATQAIVAFSLAMVLAGGAILYVFKVRDTSERAVFLLALFLIPVMGALSNTSAALVGLRRVVMGQFPNLALRPLIFTLLLLAVIHSGLAGASTSTPAFAMFLNVLAGLLALGVSTFLFMRALPQNMRATPRTVINQKTWARSILPLSLIAGASIVFTNVDILMLGFLEDYETVGLYRVASRGAVLLSVVLYAVNTSIAPFIVRLYFANNLRGLQKLVSLTAMGVTALTLPFFLFFVLYDEQIIGLVFGEEYLAAATALSILCVGQMVSVVFGSVGLVLNMTGHESETARSAVFAAVLNLLLNYPLILLFGIEGAAIATALSLIALNVFRAWRVRVNTGLILLPIPAYKLRREFEVPSKL